MLLTKANIDGNHCWVEKTAAGFYLLDADESKMTFVRKTKIEGVDESLLIFVNPFVGKNVYGLAYNYKDLVGFKDKYEEPLIFLKSIYSTCPNNSAISFPKDIENLWAEVELVIIIAEECRNIKAEEAAHFIFGYTIGSDITAQNICGRDHHLARSKALDNFAPIGPWINTKLDTKNLHLENIINGALFQSGNTNNRIKNDYESVSMLSKYFTLFPGDIIFTGTPANAMNSRIKRGDSITHSIEGLGQLRFSIAGDV